MFTKQDINNLRIFLGRASLQGSEVGAFIEIANKLTDMEESLKPKVKVRKNGNKDSSTANQ